MRTDIFEGKEITLDIENANGDATLRVLNDALLAGRQFGGRADYNLILVARFWRSRLINDAEGVIEGGVFAAVTLKIDVTPTG